jgi:hypothetical protein
MSTNVNQNFIDYFAEFKNVPEKWEEAQNFFNWYLTQTTNFLNAKSIGVYSSELIPSGKQIYVTSTAYDVLRVTVIFGPLPNSTTKTVPHGLVVDGSFRLLNLYLTANNTTGNKYFCLQYYSIAPGDIVLSMDATNIIVTTMSDYSSFNMSLAIVEFATGVS